jgi:hypothetical protein
LWGTETVVAFPLAADQGAYLRSDPIVCPQRVAEPVPERKAAVKGQTVLKTPVTGNPDAVAIFAEWL